MRKLLLTISLLVFLALSGCSASDPVTEHIYFTGLDTTEINYTNPYYEEISIPSSHLVGLGIASDPAKSNAQSGLVYIFTDEVAINEKQLYFTFQMPHNYKEGTDLIPVVHFIYNADEVGTRVRWSIRYSWANVGDNFPVSTPVWKNSDLANNDSLKHQVTKFDSIDGAGKEISSHVLCYLSRNSSHVDDTYVSNVKVTGISVLYQIDSPGSSSEWVK